MLAPPKKAVPISQCEVSVSLVKTVLETARSLGISNTGLLLKQAGIDPDLLSESENRIPFALHEKLWQAAVTQTGDAHFGLKLGIQTQPASHSVLGYIMTNSATIGEALDATEKYQVLSGEGGKLCVKRDRRYTTTSYAPINSEKGISHQRVCGVLAAQVNLGRWLVGDSFQPEKVCFTVATLADPAPYEELFRCPVQFGARQNRVTYPRSVDQLPIPLASHDMLKLMKQRADAVIRRLATTNTMAGQVTKLLVSSLIGQEPDKGLIAQKLGISQRTLQRKLLKENTTYQKILDNTRQRLALEYLQQSQLTVTDITYLLGFTEPSAFYRIFKKWQGVTPGQYREHQNNLNDGQTARQSSALTPTVTAT